MRSRRPRSRSNSLADMVQRYKAGLSRQWRVAKNGTPYKLGGWWEVTKCKKCKEPRYAYERIGTIFANRDAQGNWLYRRRAFAAGQIGSNAFTESLRPTEISKPELTCFCDVEP